jgi:DNA repair protein RecN (Recombination protein N)
MLQKLSIKNFALIDSLEMNFQDGFTIITGETGAGKSILLGGLSLILGKRADLSSLKDKEKKCVIEGEFSVEKYKLNSFFEENDIDFEARSIIRREILPSGKSRAFINDTPVVLSTLSALSEKLIDIHSQHQTLQLADVNFQFKIIDALAKNDTYVLSYKRGLSVYNKLSKELKELLAFQEAAKQQYDYNLFLMQELEQADLKEDEQKKLEETLAKLTNIEGIKQSFAKAIGLANNEEFGIKSNLNSFKASIHKLSSYSEDYESLTERINSLTIEFDDIIEELQKADDYIDLSPQEIENYNERLQLIYDLQKKHSVATITEILEIKEILSVKVDQVANASEMVTLKGKEIQEVESKLDDLGTKIHDSRAKVLPNLKKKLEQFLADLAMENTRFQIDLTMGNTFLANGKDELNLLFSANKGSNFESLKKVASGGEMSRIMLSVKALLSKHTNLPTILFDEIDTGVSGEVSNKMGGIMKTMSENMQVVSITHLPQIAAKGDHHFKVFKEDVGAKTITNVKQLDTNERVNELAEMLGGKDLVDSAIEHAKQLLS